jgi:hypothetical protein
VYAVPIPLLAIVGILTAGGTTWFVVVVSTLARCDVTSWRARRIHAQVRRQDFHEERPTDCAPGLAGGHPDSTAEARSGVKVGVGGGGSFPRCRARG